MDEPGQPGLRIPVRYMPTDSNSAPKMADLDFSERVVVIVLVDVQMTLKFDADAKKCAQAWGDLLVDLLEKQQKSQTLTVLPVAVDGDAFGLDDRLDLRSHVRLDVEEDNRKSETLIFHAANSALKLLRSDKAQDVEFFFSHAKADLPKDPDSLAEGPVKALLSFLAQHPVAAWYDAKKIPAGGLFNREIEEGVLRCGSLICVLTDEYSSREWCRREALVAKQAGRPIVLVDAIDDDVPRMFPYLGNCPAIRWKGENAGAEARRICSMALLEALRYEHSLRILRSRKSTGDWILGISPEALTLANLPGYVQRVIYPDPPLGHEELEPLKRIVPKIELTTPLAQLARFSPADSPRLIGLSLSNASDSAQYGVSQEHLATVANDLVLYLLLAGLRVGYGGMLGFDGAGPDYVQRLFGLVKTYSPLATQLGRKFQPIENFVGWPIHLTFGPDQLKQYGSYAELLRIDKPELPGVDEDALYAEGKPGFFGTDTPPRRFAWAVSMTKMRAAMTEKVSARVVMGGALSGFQGLYPGVFEEAVQSLEAEQPLYLVGAFGGAARLVIDLLDIRKGSDDRVEGGSREEMTTLWLKQHVDTYDEVVELYRNGQLSLKTPEEYKAQLNSLGVAGIDKALNNGLDEVENRELFYSPDPNRIIELILQGMHRIF